MIKQSSKIFVSINIPGNRFSLNTNTQKQILGTGKERPGDENIVPISQYNHISFSLIETKYYLKPKKRQDFLLNQSQKQQKLPPFTIHVESKSKSNKAGTNK